LFFGGGFKLGAYYHVTSTVDTGFGYTSPQWLETWSFNSRDELGNPRTLKLRATLPAIYSWGLPYRGIQGLALATDLRFIDNQNPVLFGTPVRAGGLGWQNQFAIAVGGQYEVTEGLSVRAGYLYNSNAVPTIATLFNIQAPAITQHTISAGFSMRLAESISASFAYAYAFENTQRGTIFEFPGTNVSFRTSAHSILFGLTIRFGGTCCHEPSCTTPAADA